jgi:dihydrofolate reductase
MAELWFPVPPLAGDVVLLRPWREAYVPGMVLAFSDPVMKRFSWRTAPYTETDARDYFAEQEEARLRGEGLNFALAGPHDQDVVLGSVSLSEVRLDHGCAAVGYWLAPAYEAIARSMTTTATDHPFAGILNAGRKVVFSRTLKTAEWANTTIAAGDTAEEIDKLRQGGDGHIVVWGGVSLWRSLMRLDLIDELQLSLFPYVAGEGTRLFDGVPKSYRLDLVSSTASSSGILELQYRRHR